MKQFLYLDTDIVSSILAQAEKGLVISASAEKGVSKSDGETFGSEVNTDGKISGSLLKLVSAEAKITGKLSGTENSSATYNSREIVSKTLHDAAFDMAYN